LGDLVFVNEIPDKIGRLFNFHKLRVQAKFLQRICQYQRIGYNLVNFLIT